MKINQQRNKLKSSSEYYFFMLSKNFYGKISKETYK